MGERYLITVQAVMSHEQPAGGCAGSLKPTRLSLQFGEMQGDLAQLQGQCLHIQQKTPCISVAWMGFSLIRGAGRP
jgi:hypothetical protein